jgi:hypothetical protein
MKRTKTKNDQDYHEGEERLDVRDFEISEAEEESPNKTQNGKSKRKKVEFTERDISAIKEGIQKHGRSFANIQKDFFTGTQIARQDIQNFVNNSQELRKLASYSHKEVKNSIKSQFDKSVAKYSSQNNENANKTEQNYSIKCESSKLPNAHGDGILIRHKQFLLARPFFKEVEKYYIYFYLTNLLQTIDWDFDTDENAKIHLIIKLAPADIKLYPEILNESEYSKTKGKISECVQTEDNLTTFGTVELPEDVCISNKVKCFLNPTHYGLLHEIWIPKIQKLEISKLIGDRSRFITQSYS